MAFDQNTRNRLQRFVADCRDLLTAEFTRQLQHEYGLDPETGAVAEMAKLPPLDEGRRETARLLRETLAHYLATSPSGGNQEVLARIVREQTFTVLNRLCALRMAEARDLLLESVAQGYQSKGFRLYAHLAGTALGETGDAYRCYLFSVFDEVAVDLPVLFDRFSPQGRLFPNGRVYGMKQLLALPLLVTAYADSLLPLAAGILTGPNGPPFWPKAYPLCLDQDGVLLDDPEHPDDIIHRVREVLALIWKDRADAIDKETCEILGVKDLRDYFRKPAAFFANHLKRYSKSRRQAPIYWPLSTPSASYTLWLYYHRLDDQTLYTCVNDFVDPKLKLLAEEANPLRQKKDRNSAEEKQLERVSNLEPELADFRTELLRIAQFWKPNLNDGVQITAAPCGGCSSIDRGRTG